MDYGKGYTKELKTLNEEIKRLNGEKKNLQNMRLLKTLKSV